MIGSRFLAFTLHVACGLALAGDRVVIAAEAIVKPEHLEFFESKVRPLLVQHCFECHSSQSKAIKGGLRLDSRDALLHGGDSGEAIVPGKPDDSPMIQAIRYQGFEMPPRGKLREDEVAVLVKWVELGAPWPANDKTEAVTPGRTYDWAKLRNEHWAWQQVTRPERPAVKNTAWPKNEIDYHILAGLEAAGLEPAPAAEPRVLVRRLYLDLLGLPPTPEEVEEFVASVAAMPSPAATGPTAKPSAWDAAYAALVDRLLASPHYGERWGRYWLDVARYSDGYGGFLDNAPLPSAWRYRDWVVEALNNDMPYDEFVRLQIAGDLVDGKHAVATGFLALGPTYISDGGDPEATAQARGETLDDRVDTVTRGLMALTVACARCHDHRFDPYPQLDYYSLAGVFNNTRSRDFALVPAAEAKAYDDVEKQIKVAEGKIDKIKKLARKENNRKLTDEERAEVDTQTALRDKLRESQPPKYPFAHTLVDVGSDDMNLAVRGNLLRPGPVAPRRFLQIIAGENPAPFTRGSGRLDLADAIADATNPLTARVMANRVWQQHFGFGLVRTPSNFGTLGEKPSHPRLLDLLADELVRGAGSREPARNSPVTPRPYSLKSLHRLIVTSATYRQSSRADERALSIDGDNRLLWRMNPRRLDVEAWRDALLSATGELDGKLGGEPIPDIASSNRRTLYAAVSRNGDKFDSDTFLRLFDFPVPRATSEGRTSSIVPQQSLFLMNSKFMLQRAEALTARLAREATTNEARIERAYLLLYGRPVTDDELQLGIQFLGDDADAAKSTARWTQYAQVLLSASEMMYWE